MKTIKLPINHIEIGEMQREYTSCFRYAFNRFQEGLSEKEVRNKCRNFFNLNSWILQCSILDAKANYNSWKQNGSSENPYFGSKRIRKKYLNQEITKEEYSKSRLRKIMIQGEKLHKGNRLFDLDIIENNKIIFKPERGKKIEIFLPKLRENYKKELYELEILAKNKEITYSIGLSSDFIEIVYEPIQKSFIDRKEDRVLGIDLNPNYIGISVLKFKNNDEFEVLHKQVFDLSELNECKDAKIDFELYEICKKIINLANVYKVSKLGIEDLNIKTKSLRTGKRLNCLILNKWKRNKVFNNLQKRCRITGIEFVPVLPYYSSTIGNILYGDETTPDMIASSIEIGRRAFNSIKNKKGEYHIQKGKIYPEMIEKGELEDRWKEIPIHSIETWIDLHNEIKKSKLNYRFQLNENYAVFRKSYKKLRIRLYSF